jgi:hypothetical protein
MKKIRSTSANVRHVLGAYLLAVAFCLAMPVSLKAQVAGGTIQGTILDTSGGAVPGVQVSRSRLAIRSRTSEERRMPQCSSSHLGTRFQAGSKSVSTPGMSGTRTSPAQYPHLRLMQR